MSDRPSETTEQKSPIDEALTKGELPSFLQRVQAHNDAHNARLRMEQKRLLRKSLAGAPKPFLWLAFVGFRWPLQRWLS